MTALAVQRLTYADYLALEAESGLRHEFWSGEVWAMTGGSMDHSLLKTAAVMLLGPALRAAGRPCRLLDSDAKLWLGASDMAVYPDLSVVCGPILRPPHDPNAAVNPVLVMEVLSPSTAHRDLGLKRAAYMRVPGLQHTLQAAGSLPAFYATVESTRRLDVKTRHAQLCDAPLGTTR